jgi:4-hydroxy-3-methylbut-2-en-1-yl diphosphate reductase
MYSVSLAVRSRTGQGFSAVVAPAVAGMTTAGLPGDVTVVTLRSPGRLGRATYDGDVALSPRIAPRPGSPLADDVPARGRVLLAAPRGYCAGVDRAVVAVEKALELHGAPVYVRKQIVHNKHVVATLERRGAVFVDDTDEVPEGAIVVFSAHGVAPAVHEAAQRRHLQTIDATCPLVTKVHKEAVRFATSDYDILLIGHAGHEEVEGTSGEAPSNITLVESPDHVDAVVVRDPEKVVWLSQTTLSVDETMETVRRLRERFPNLQDPPSDDICYATQNRQVAVKKIAAESDLLLVVGSANSSNSVRLVEVALEHGAAAAHRVDDATEIDEAWLDEVGIVGVTSGASVPEVLVHDVLAWLDERGFGPAEEVVTAEEDLLFSLPKELRRDIKAARGQATAQS